MKKVVISLVFFLTFYRIYVTSGFEDLQLQTCAQKGTQDEDFFPLNDTPTPAIQFKRDKSSPIQVDVCDRDKVVKIDFPVVSGIDDHLTLCINYVRGAISSARPTCYDISGMSKDLSNTTMTCWFQREVIKSSVVIEFFVRQGRLDPETSKHHTYYSSTKLQKDMCNEPICQRVEPVYGYRFHCGGSGRMYLPSQSDIIYMDMTCYSCQCDRELKLGFEVSKVDSSDATLYFEEDLEAGNYNLTVVLQINDTDGKTEFCSYKKLVTIVCKGDDIDTGSGEEPRLFQSTDGTDTSCGSGAGQSSFITFVLFGLTVSAVSMVLICIVTFIFMKRKNIMKALCSFRHEDSGNDVEINQQMPMITRSSPVSLHVPRHARFHRMDDYFKLIFLPHPYDTFTRDCVNCLRKVLTLDGRIHSACVFDTQVSSDIFSNKFTWIENTLNDVDNVLIFLCFTSISTKHDLTIVDDVIRMCKTPATKPRCQTLLCHVTDGPDPEQDINFLGSTFNIMNEQGYKQFLETVYSIYGYKSDNEHDRQKFRHILQSGASKHFLRQLNANPIHHV